jgi:hypothetical protein
MRRMKTLGLTITAMLILIPALFAADVRLEAELVGPAIEGVKPGGDADFRADGDRRRLSVEVEDVNFPDGTMLMVKVEGYDVGVIMLDGGEGELDLDSADGDMVRAVYEGDTVKVFYNDLKILTGVFMVED